MSLTYTDACDEMQALFKTAWDSLSAAAVGAGASIPPVQWPGIVGDPPNPVAPFARFNLRHIVGSQATFGRTNERRFQRNGLITVQVFGPIADTGLVGGGFSVAKKLAIIARDAYEGVGTSSGLWFRNVRIVEVGPDKLYHQVQCLAEFEYDELK